MEDKIIYDLVLFHAPCPDGFGATWSYYHFLKELAASWQGKLSLVYGYYEKEELVEALYILEINGMAKKIKFIREDHRWASTLKMLKEEPKTSKVLYLDICPKRELLQQVHAYFDDCQVLDHHITAKNDCGDLPYTFFDMDRSGAGIAWDWFCQARRPLLIDLIEDRDIWKWQVPNAHELLLVVEMYRRTFSEWDVLSHRLTDDYDACLVEGTAYLRYHNKVIDCLSTKGKTHSLQLGEEKLLAINCNFYQSDIGNKLSLLAKNKMAAVYYTPGNGWLVSLRSTKDGPDVSEIAKLYGGGGHRNAAAFRIDNLEELRPSELSQEELEAMSIDVLVH